MREVRTEEKEKELKVVLDKADRQKDNSIKLIRKREKTTKQDNQQASEINCNLKGIFLPVVFTLSSKHSN